MKHTIATLALIFGLSSWVNACQPRGCWEKPSRGATIVIECR